MKHEAWALHLDEDEVNDLLRERRERAVSHISGPSPAAAGNDVGDAIQGGGPLVVVIVTAEHQSDPIAFEEGDELFAKRWLATVLSRRIGRTVGKDDRPR